MPKQAGRQALGRAGDMLGHSGTMLGHAGPMLCDAGTMLSHAGVLEIQFLISSKRETVVSFSCSGMLFHAGAAMRRARTC
jgi:hypothetical protein